MLFSYHLDENVLVLIPDTFIFSQVIRLYAVAIVDASAREICAVTIHGLTVRLIIGNITEQKVSLQTVIIQASNHKQKVL